MQEAAELAKALEGNTHLTELYASGHELNAEAVKLLAAAVAKNQTLRVLCIGNASFGDSGTAALVEGLVGNTTLQQLDLESKSLGPQGAAALGKALSTGLGVETLLLARNPLTNEGAAATKSIRWRLSETARAVMLLADLGCYRCCRARTGPCLQQGVPLRPQGLQLDSRRCREPSAESAQHADHTSVR